MKKYLLFIMCLLGVGIPSLWADTVTTTLTKDDLAATNTNYKSFSVTKDNVTYIGGSSVQSDGIGIKNGTSGANGDLTYNNGIFVSSVPTGYTVKSITLKGANHGASTGSRKFKVYGSSSAYNGSETTFDTQLKEFSISKTDNGVDCVVSGDDFNNVAYPYFAIVANSSNMIRFDEIVIEWNTSTPPPAPTYTVYYDNNSWNWSTVKAYVYDASENAYKSWDDAEELVPTSITGIYKYEFTPSASFVPAKIIFRDNGSYQTPSSGGFDFVNNGFYTNDGLAVIAVAGAFNEWSATANKVTADKDDTLAPYVSITVPNWSNNKTEQDEGFKIVSGNVWYGKDNTVLSNGIELDGLSPTGANISLPASAEGQDVTFTFNYETKKLTASWYEPYKLTLSFWDGSSWNHNYQQAALDNEGFATFTISSWPENAAFKVVDNNPASAIWYGKGSEAIDHTTYGSFVSTVQGGTNNDFSLPASAVGKQVTIEFDNNTKKVKASWDSSDYVKLVGAFNSWDVTTNPTTAYVDYSENVTMTVSNFKNTVDGQGTGFKILEGGTWKTTATQLSNGVTSTELSSDNSLGNMTLPASAEGKTVTFVYNVANHTLTASWEETTTPTGTVDTLTPTNTNISSAYGLFSYTGTYAKYEGVAILQDSKLQLKSGTQKIDEVTYNVGVYVTDKTAAGTNKVVKSIKFKSVTTTGANRYINIFGDNSAFSLTGTGLTASSKSYVDQVSIATTGTYDELVYNFTETKYKYVAFRVSAAVQFSEIEIEWEDAGGSTPELPDAPTAPAFKNGETVLDATTTVETGSTLTLTVTSATVGAVVNVVSEPSSAATYIGNGNSEVTVVVTGACTLTAVATATNAAGSTNSDATTITITETTPAPTPDWVAATEFSSVAVNSSKQVTEGTFLSNPAITYTIDKGGSGNTQATYYEKNKTLRIYKGNTLTITAPRGVKITQIVFTAVDNDNSLNADANATVEYGSLAYDGATVTWTAPTTGTWSGQDVITISNLAKAWHLVDASFTYVQHDVVAAPVFKVNGTATTGSEVEEGTQVVVTSATEGASVNVSINPTTAGTIANNGSASVTVTLNASATLTATASKADCADSEAATASFTVTSTHVDGTDVLNYTNLGLTTSWSEFEKTVGFATYKGVARKGSAGDGNYFELINTKNAGSYSGIYLTAKTTEGQYKGAYRITLTGVRNELTGNSTIYVYGSDNAYTLPTESALPTNKAIKSHVVYGSNNDNYSANPYTVTFDLDPAQKFIAIRTSGRLGFESVTIEWKTTAGTPTFSSTGSADADGYTYINNVSGQATITITSPGADKIAYRINGGEWVETDVTSPYQVKPVIKRSELGSIVKIEAKAGVTENDVTSWTSTVSETFRLKAPAGTFTMVDPATANTTLQAGDKVVITYMPNPYQAWVMGRTTEDTDKTNNPASYLYPVNNVADRSTEPSTAGGSDYTITPPSDALVFTVGGNATDGWLLIDETTGQYLRLWENASGQFSAYRMQLNSTYSETLGRLLLSTANKGDGTPYMLRAVVPAQGETIDRELAYTTGSGRFGWLANASSSANIQRTTWFVQHPASPVAPTDPKYEAVAPTFSFGDSNQFDSSKSVKIYSAGATSIKYQVVLNGADLDDEAWVTVEGSSASFSVNRTCTVYAIGYKNDTPTEQTSQAFNKVVPEGEFKRLTSRAELVQGERIVIAYTEATSQGSADDIMSTTSGKNASNINYLLPTTDEAKLFSTGMTSINTMPSDALILVVDIFDKENGIVSLRQYDGTYLNYRPSGNPNGLVLSPTQQDGDISFFKFAAEGTGFTIQTVVDDYSPIMSLGYNTQTTPGRFQFYSSFNSQVKPVSIYHAAARPTASTPTLTPGEVESVEIIERRGQTVDINVDDYTTAVVYKVNGGDNVTVTDFPASIVIDQNEMEIEIKAINADGWESAAATYDYMINYPDSDITFEPADGTSIEYNGEVVIKAEKTDGTCDAEYIAFTLTNSDDVVTGPFRKAVDPATHTITIKLAESCTVTAWPEIAGEPGYEPVTNDTKINLASYTVAGATFDIFTRATSLGEIQAGDEIIIAADYVYKGSLVQVGLSNEEYKTSSATYRTPVPVNIYDNKLEDPSLSVAVITLGGNATDGWTLLTADGYLAAAATGNKLLTINDDPVPANAKVDITFGDDGVPVIKFRSDEDHPVANPYLRYNHNAGTNPRFATYGETSKTTLPGIYVLTTHSTVAKIPTVEVVDDGVTYDDIDGVRYYHNPIKIVMTPGHPTQYMKYAEVNPNDPEQCIATETYEAGETVELTISRPYRLQIMGGGGELADSPYADHYFRFKPATPTVSVVENPVTFYKYLTFASATIGAEIEYRINPVDENAEWTVYTDDAVELSDEGNYVVEVRSRKKYYTEEEWTTIIGAGTESYTYSAQTLSMSIDVANPDNVKPFTLVTNVDQLRAGDEVIIVAANADFAAAPYVDGANNVGAAPVVKVGNSIVLSDTQTDVAIMKLGGDATNGWTFETEVSDVRGHLYAAGMATDRNLLKVAKPADITEGADKAQITVSLSGETYVSDVVFAPTSTAGHNILRYNNAGLFSCYTANQQPVALYTRDPRERCPRPTVSPAEGIYDLADFPASLTISIEVPEGKSASDFTIHYTTDGTNPRNESPTTKSKVGASCPVEGFDHTSFIRAYVTADGMADSYSLLASYYILPDTRTYTRVTGPELQNLKPNDEVIIAASPSNNDDYYILGRNQVNQVDGMDITQYRDAIPLTSTPNEFGQLQLTLSPEYEKLVQPMTLLPSANRTSDGYDWRLYASGSYENGIHTEQKDGFLYSAGENNSLATVRLQDPSTERMADASVRFISESRGGIGNEYGGVTVKFGSANGHEDDWPNYLALRHYANSWRFNCYTLEQITGEADGFSDAEIYHVSLFKVYDPSTVSAPTFSKAGGRVPQDSNIELYCATPDANIYYIIDPEGLDFSDPDFNFDFGSVGVWTLYDPAHPIVFTVPEENHRIVAVAQKHGEGITTEISAVTDYTFSVTPVEYFRLVKTGDVLRENDRIIIVNAAAYPANKDFDPENPDYSFYAMTTRIMDGSNQYWLADRVEVEEYQKDEFGHDDIMHPELLKIDNEDIAILTLERDGSGSASTIERPWLVRIEGTNLYLESADKRKLRQRTLPPMLEREKMNAATNIFDAIYTGEKNTGDFTGYLFNSLHDAYTSNAVRGDIANKGTIIFSGIPEGKEETVLTTLRFNPNGKGGVHFNAYGYEINEETGRPKVHDLTWPVAIYRATDRVLSPSISVYPSVFDTDESSATFRKITSFDDDAYAAEASKYPNPVLVEIDQSPKTARNADLLYAWSTSPVNLPVSSEYTAAPGNKLRFIVDGYRAVLLPDEPVFTDGKLDWNVAGSTEFNIADNPTIFAMAQLGIENYSPSQSRMLNFRTVAPILTNVSASHEGSDTYVRISRPAKPTYGSIVVYTLDGTEPTVTFDENGNVTITKGTLVGAYSGATFDEETGYTHIPSGSFLLSGNGFTSDDIKLNSAADPIIVGAFKWGYQPSFNTMTQFTYYPHCRPIQLLELSADGQEALGTNHKYLTYRDEENSKEGLDPEDYLYYTIDYTVDASDNIDHIDITEVSTEDALAIIANPMLFKWTADYYLFALEDKPFLTAMKVAGANVVTITGITIHDNYDETGVTAIESDVNSANFGSYYGTVLRRHGSLGRDAIEVKMTYEISTDGGVTFAPYYSAADAEITPVIPGPHSLKYRYEAYRDDPEIYTDHDCHYLIPSLRSNIPGNTEIVDGQELGKLISADNTGEADGIIVRKDDFTTRHFDCIFEFVRPNVVGDIIDNYDIVYDITVRSLEKNGEDGNGNPTYEVNQAITPLVGKFSDPTHTSDAEYKDQEFYKFIVRDVNPTEDFFPDIKINSVTFYANGENDGYTHLVANYAPSGAVADNYKEEIIAPNLVDVTNPADVKLYMGYWENTANGVLTYDWAIRGHESINDATVTADDPNRSGNDANIEAPFFYMVEAYYPGSDETMTPFAIPFLIKHDPDNCYHGWMGNEVWEQFSDLDPFCLLDYPIVRGFSDPDHIPSVVLTPVYIFTHTPATSVEEEGALADYIDYGEQHDSKPATAPALRAANAPARAPEGVFDDKPLKPLPADLLVIQGSKPTTFLAKPEDGLVTGFVEIGMDEIDADAVYYNLQGMRIDADNLRPGYYICVKGAETTKILLR